MRRAETNRGRILLIRFGRKCVFHLRRTIKFSMARLRAWKSANLPTYSSKRSRDLVHCRLVPSVKNIINDFETCQTELKSIESLKIYPLMSLSSVKISFSVSLTHSLQDWMNRDERRCDNEETASCSDYIADITLSGTARREILEVTILLRYYILLLLLLLHHHSSWHFGRLKKTPRNLRPSARARPAKFVPIPFNRVYERARSRSARSSTCHRARNRDAIPSLRATLTTTEESSLRGLHWTSLLPLLLLVDVKYNYAPSGFASAGIFQGSDKFRKKERKRQEERG